MPNLKKKLLCSIYLLVFKKDKMVKNLILEALLFSKNLSVILDEDHMSRQTYGRMEGH